MQREEREQREREKREQLAATVAIEDAANEDDLQNGVQLLPALEESGGRATIESPAGLRNSDSNLQVKVSKRPKKIPNYMKPNAAWLGKDKNDESSTKLKLLQD